MALILADRVKETTTTTGTGTLSLAGAVAGFQSFVAGVGTTNTTYYAITDSATGAFEVGIGTVTSGSPDTLSRGTVLESSNSDNLVNFGAGQKIVICTQPAEKAVYLDASDQLVIDGTSVTATAAELNYVDGVTSNIQTQLDAKVAKAGGTMTGFLTLHADPTNAFHAATKEYVDSIAAASLHYHDPVRVESPVALTATYNNGTSGVGATLTNAGTQAALVIDGITLLLNDRALIFHQANAFENGVYFVSNVGSGSTNWVLTRSTDTDSYGASDPDALGLGDAFYVLEGDTGAGQLYVMNTEGAITIGTTGITFAEISSAQIYVGGSGIEISGTTISHSDTSSQASVNNSNGTVIQDVTLDTFGHVTALGSADLDGRYYTETEIDSTVSGLNSAIALKQDAATALTTSTTFGGDVSGTYNAIVVANDSHTHDTRYYTETETGSFFAGTTAITGYNKTNWDTAHGWGNHASAGYLTGTLTGNLNFGDNNKAIFGAGNDLQIYHDGSNTYIDESAGVGNLIIKGANVQFQTPTSETYLAFANNGAVTAYYDNAAKLATTATGIDVTGTVTADGLISSAAANISGGGWGILPYVANSFVVDSVSGQTRLFATGTDASTHGNMLFFTSTTNGTASERLRIDSSGNVGIGTSTIRLSEKLHVLGQGIVTSSAENTNMAMFGTFGTNEQLIGSFNNIPVVFRQHNTERMRLDTSGNLLVGKTAIGVTTEGAEVRNNGLIAAARDLTGSSGSVLYLNRIGVTDGPIQTFYKDGTTVGSIDTAGGTLQFKSGNSGIIANSGLAAVYPLTPSSTDLGYSTVKWRNLYLSGTLTNNGTGGIQIDTSGNVGIGTTAPDAPLHVKGDLNYVSALNANGTITISSDDTGNNGFDGAPSIVFEAPYNTGTIRIPYAIIEGRKETTAAGITSGFLAFSTAAVSSGGTTERLRITSSGNVGIGTASPSNLLHVKSSGSGTVALFGDSVANNTVAVTRTTTSPSYIALNVSPAAAGITGGPRLAFATSADDGSSAVERMRLDSSGRLLVGTTTGTEKLTVNGAISIKNGSDVATFQMGVYSGTFRFQNQAGNPLPLTFWVSDSEKMRINTSGQVGIGTSSPSARLQIGGMAAGEQALLIESGRNDVLSNGLVRINITDSVCPFAGLQIDHAGTGAAIIANGKVEVTGTGTGLPATSGTTQTYGRIRTGGSGSNVVLDIGNAGASGAWLQVTNKTNLTNESPLLLNPNGGNVGIGTTSPAGNLHISGSGASDEPTLLIQSENSSIYLRTAGSSGSFPSGGGGNDGELLYLGGDFRVGIGDASKNLIFMNGSGYTERARIDSSGNLGIGTSSPGAKLDVVSSSANLGRFTATNGYIDLIDPSVTGRLQVSGNVFYIGTTASGDMLAFKTGANTERMRLDTNGNLGIGTTAPSTLLHVSSASTDGGKILIQSGTLTNNNRATLFMSAQNVNGQTGNVSIECIHPNNQQSDMVFRTGATDATSFGTERMRIDTSGNVGIGTTSPGQRFHVDGGRSTFYSQDSYAVGVGNASGALGGWIGSPALNVMSFSEPGGVERMRIDSSGRVGIGTTAAKSLLTVGNNTSTASSTSGISACDDVAGDVTLLTMYNQSQDASATAIIEGRLGQAANANTAAGKIIFGKEGTWTNTASTRDGYIAFTTALNAGFIERLRITSTGNLGIGTSSPSARLHVNDGSFVLSNSTTTDLTITGGTGNQCRIFFGDSGSSTQGRVAYDNSTDSLQVDTNGSERLRILSNGNVGIGTTSPTGKMDVQTATDSKLVFQDGNTAGNTRISSVNSAYSAYKNFELNTAQTLFFTNGAERMRIDSSGNVGIGTSSPSYKLSVAGNSATSSNILLTHNTDSTGAYSRIRFQFAEGNTSIASEIRNIQRVAGASGSNLAFFTENNSGTLAEAARIDSSGNVGIGTTGGAGKLQVKAATNQNLVVQGSVSLANSVVISAVNDAANANVPLELRYGTNTAFIQDGTERLRIDSSGNLLVGKTTTVLTTVGWDLGPNGTGHAAFTIASGTNEAFVWNNTSTGGTAQIEFRAANAEKGNITWNNTSTSYNTSSDYRLKNITGPITNSGDYIDSLNPVEGTWKVDGSTFVGLIAHEVQEVSRTFVATGEKDGEKMQGMDYSSAEIIANLIAEVKSLRQRVATLESN
jgi:hypothetical protein